MASAWTGGIDFSGLKAPDVLAAAYFDLCEAGLAFCIACVVIAALAAVWHVAAFGK